MHYLTTANCLWYFNYYFITYTQAMTQVISTQQNVLQMPHRGVNEREITGNFLNNGHQTFTQLMKYHKCIQALILVILSSVWAWLATFLLCMASPHNHLMLLDSLIHTIMCAQRGLEDRRTTSDGKTKWRKGERMSLAFQAISAKTKQTQRVRIILSGQ